MRVPRDNDRRLLTFARRMRKDSTDAEAKLWSILRGGQLAGFKFRRQHRVAGYILDVYCVERRLAVELDGGQHAEPVDIEYDAARTSRLSNLGVRVLRFWDNDVLKKTNIVADEIYRQLEQPPSPQPSPRVPGEGERGT